jgi:hypothetical protein
MRGIIGVVRIINLTGAISDFKIKEFLISRFTESLQSTFFDFLLFFFVRITFYTIASLVTSFFDIFLLDDRNYWSVLRCYHETFLLLS